MITEIDYKDLVAQKSTKNKFELVEQRMLDMPQVPCSVIHRFGPGIYMREVSLPAGSLIMGHHQNFEHINVFLKGHITFFKDNGERVEMKAPMTFVGQPGRKMAYIHEDTLWMNVYKTDETDIEKLECYLLTKSDYSIQDKENINKTLLLNSAVDKGDFGLFLTEFGLSEETVREMSENKEDMTDLPYGGYKIKVSKSNIEGLGLIATADIDPGEMIAPARMNGKRTIAGRYTNHSLFPNAKMVRIKDGDIALIATQKISGCLGGRDGEEVTTNYRESLKLTLEIDKGA